MARVFLINPKTDEVVRTPLLSFLYLVASLRRAGHSVGVVDGSAPFAPADLAAAALAFEPDLIGIHTKTLYVQDVYALAQSLRSHRISLVCGGPHPTVVPLEPLGNGFDFSVIGEGEETLVELCDALDGKRTFGSVKSLVWSAGGVPQLNESRGFLLHLDELANPADGLDAFDPRWYGSAATVPPAGLLSSRGCPAACTFCCNNVTGRRFRYRSAVRIREEIAAFKARAGFSAFSFFDDSFAVGQRRVNELCDQLDGLGVHWTCTAHPAHLDPEILVRMKRAGCTGVDIGMESGDPAMLVRIGKGVTVERVLDVLRWSRDIGLHCMLNIMFGWPDETVDELRTTVDFIDRAAPLAAAFNARGVLTPYPGTEVYDKHHARFGFTDWWIREEPLRYSPFPSAWSLKEVKRAYADDAAVKRNFFRLPDAHLELIQRGLQKKADYTYSKLEKPAVPGWEPNVAAAGAR